VSKVAKELNAAIAKLQCLSGLNFTPVSEQIKALDSSLGGGVLSIAGPDLARQMFDRYFQEAAPFEARKKSEFPDAAALLTLESHAKATQKQGILISRDSADLVQNRGPESRTPPEGGADSLHVEPSSREVRAGHPQTSFIV
jgi:hypothetical protein